jgi:hypothetical protein
MFIYRERKKRGRDVQLIQTQRKRVEVASR